MYDLNDVKFDEYECFEYLGDVCNDIDITYLDQIATRNQYKDMDVYMSIRENENKVFMAIYEEDLENLKMYIESEKLDVNAIDSGETLLHFAIMVTNETVIDYLLSRDDILVDVVNAGGETPLVKAARYSQFGLVKKFVQAGADVNLADNCGITPLHHASVHDSDMAHFLIQNGADIEAVDETGATPLHNAIAHGRAYVMHMLLYYNADVNTPRHNGFTALMSAMLVETLEAQNTLFDYVDISNLNQCTDSGRTALSIALTRENPSIMEIMELIRRGADVNYGDFPQVSLEECAFKVCLDIGNLDIFKAVWEKLRYNPKRDAVNLSLIFHKSDGYCLQDFIQVIIDSDNVDLAVKSLTEHNNYHIFIKEFASCDLLLTQLEQLTCRLLMYGYRATTSDIYQIFSLYGYCELLKLLRYMDNNYLYGWLPHLGCTRLIFDLNYELRNDANNMSINDIKWVLRRFVDASFINHLKIYYLRLQYDCSGQEEISIIRDVEEVLNRLPNMPSLVELARNAARKHIRKSFKVASTCQFYTIIDHIALLPAVCKKILTLEKELYI